MHILSLEKIILLALRRCLYTKLDTDVVALFKTG